MISTQFIPQPFSFASRALDLYRCSAPHSCHTHTPPSDCLGSGILSSAPGKWVLLNEKIANSNPLISDQIGRSLLDLSNDLSNWSFRMLQKVPRFSSWSQGSQLRRINETAEGTERTWVSESLIEQLDYPTWDIFYLQTSGDRGKTTCLVAEATFIWVFCYL